METHMHTQYADQSAGTQVEVLTTMGLDDTMCPGLCGVTPSIRCRVVVAFSHSAITSGVSGCDAQRPKRPKHSNPHFSFRKLVHKIAMGKSTGPIQEEFAILRLLLIQTAKDADRCLKALERNLGKYDRRHGLHFRSTSKHFMRNDIRVVKDVTMDLRHVAKRINRSKYPTKSEVNAARISMNAAADAMNDLKHAGRVFDQNNGMSGGVTGIIDNILSHNDNDSEGNGGLFGNNDDKTLEPKRKGGFFSNTKTFLQTPDTLEEVVRLTLRDNFGGVSPLKHQISATESALSPSFAARAKEAVVDVAHKFIGDTSPSPTSNDGRTYSL